MLLRRRVFPLVVNPKRCQQHDCEHCLFMQVCLNQTNCRERKVANVDLARTHKQRQYEMNMIASMTSTLFVVFLSFFYIRLHHLHLLFCDTIPPTKVCVSGIKLPTTSTCFGQSPESRETKIGTWQLKIGTWICLGKNERYQITKWW